jgi:hypothetical protein
MGEWAMVDTWADRLSFFHAGCADIFLAVKKI